MRSTATQALKLLLLLFVATSGAVLMAVSLHNAGGGGKPAALSLKEAALPQFVSSTSLPVASLRPLPVVRVQAMSQPAVMRAIPVTEPMISLAEAVTAPPQSKPLEPLLPVTEPRFMMASLNTMRDYEPFTVEPDPLIERLQKAVPLPVLQQAALAKDLEWIQRLLRAGFPVDECAPGSDTPLCIAIKARHTKMVELLLQHGANPELPGIDGQPPLALAALLRSEGVLPALLAAGADANATFHAPVPEALIKQVPFDDLVDELRNDRGVTALMAVAARGDAEGVIALMKYGAGPDRCTKTYYRYPIQFAAEQGYLYVMRLLLRRAADSEPDILITVDLSQQRAYLKKDGDIIDSTDVSTGRSGFATPKGRYVITDKNKARMSNIYHVEMPWFMRLNCSAIGLHAGHVTGEPASHGCIRLPYDVARKWYSMVKTGDEVEVVR